MDTSPRLHNISAYLLENENGPSYGTQPSREVMHTVKLKSPLSKLNFACAMIHYILIIFTSAMILMLQAFLILDPDYYKFNPQDAGLLISMIVAIQIILKACFSSLYARWSERFGRKVIICYGALSFLLGCVLLALQKDIFPGLVISSVLICNGNTALTIVPLFATYNSEDPRAKNAGLSTFFVGFGIVLANLLLKILFYKDVSLKTCCLITGGIALVGFVANSFGITERGLYEENREQSEGPVPPTTGLGEAIDSLKSNGWLIISLILQMLASADFFIFMTFLTLYIKAKFTFDTDENENVIVNNIQTMIFIPSLLFSLFFGFCVTTLTRAFIASIFIVGGGICAFVLLCAAQTATDGYMIVGAILAGATIPIINVISGYMGVKNFTPHTRNILVGLMGLFGGLSYFVIAIVGGIVYKYWRYDGIFIISAALLAVGLIVVVIIYKLKVRK